jgi:hypothetical protein
MNDVAYSRWSAENYEVVKNGKFDLVPAVNEYKKLRRHLQLCEVEPIANNHSLALIRWFGIGLLLFTLSIIGTPIAFYFRTDLWITIFSLAGAIGSYIVFFTLTRGQEFDTAGVIR